MNSNSISATSINLSILDCFVLTTALNDYCLNSASVNSQAPSLAIANTVIEATNKAAVNIVNKSLMSSVIGINLDSIDVIDDALTELKDNNEIDGDIIEYTMNEFMLNNHDKIQKYKPVGYSDAITLQSFNKLDELINSMRESFL